MTSRFKRSSRNGSEGQATTEVLKGLVGVTGSQAEVAVAETFGVSVSPTAVGAPLKLPPTPKLLRGGRAQEDAVVTFEVEPVADAVAYRLQLAHDAGFIDTFAETRSDKTRDQPGLETPQVVLTDLPPGTYHWRVTATRLAKGQITEKVGGLQELTVGQ